MTKTGAGRSRVRSGTATSRRGRFSLTVQSETQPYAYVSVEGPVVAFDAGADAEERRAIHERYLGIEAAVQVLAETAQYAKTMVTIRMRPERWNTADYSGDFS
jgi:hypothetical protein